MSDLSTGSGTHDPRDFDWFPPQDQMQTQIALRLAMTPTERLCHHEALRITKLEATLQMQRELEGEDAID